MTENMNERKGGNGMDEPRAPRKNFNDWWRERSLPEKILAGFGFALLGIGLLALLGWITMLLWNWLMPDLFGLKHINYWQAWGLLILSTILFKGLGSNNSSSSNSRNDRKRKQQLRRYMQEDADTGD